MRIDLETVQQVAAPREEVWKKLLDPNFVAGCAPGVEGVETTGENKFRAVVAASAGPVRLKFKLDFTLSELAPPASCRLAVAGKAMAGEIRADGTVRLEDDGAGTKLTSVLGADVSGMMVAVGGKNLPATARSIAGQFWRTFAERVAQATAAKP